MVRVAINRYHVESRGHIGKSVPGKIIGCNPDQLVPLAHRDRFPGAAAGGPRPGLDLDEDNGQPVAGDDVNFATSSTVPSVKNCVPLSAQCPARQFLPVFSKRSAMICVQRADPPSNTAARSLAEPSAGTLEVC